MTTFLFSGWTLTFISIAVVFTALLILYGLYSLMSWIVQKESAPKAPKTPKGDDAVAAAIALSLELEGDDSTAAAIALALELEQNSCVHDIEPGFITINTNTARGWNNKALGLRKTL